MPWATLCALIEPVYPKPGSGRPPVGIERMLRIYCLQHWFNLSDPAAAEALYNSLAMRNLVGVDLGREPIPDEPRFAASGIFSSGTTSATVYWMRYIGTSKLRE